MKRAVFTTLLDWKRSKSRKVLLLRGARQVGKTFIVRQLSKEFSHFLEVDFEQNVDVRGFFEQNLDPERICVNLSAYYGIPVIEGETLLFFDEIQSCPKALQSLRYFYESKPDLHVIAAGSLLEFALSGLSSWGVGRIRSVYMYPMSFDEFLMASGEHRLIELKRDAAPGNPLDPPIHEIATSYYDDFAKYKKRIPVLRLREVMSSVVVQAGGKYMYAKAGPLSNSAQAKEALELLEMAGLVYKVYHSSAQGVPLGSGVNYKKFKAILHDSGIFQQIAGLRVTDVIIAKNIDMINKGNIAEAFAGTEFVKYGHVYEKKQLYYWQREKSGSSAEVDYIIEQEGNVVPVEVKSGSTGKMQSMNLFISEKRSPGGIRVSMENFAQYGKITVVPLYAISNLTGYKNDR
jgi:predicted AAA+ superfamily ATPase